MEQIFVKETTPHGDMLFKLRSDQRELPQHIHTNYLLGVFFKGSSQITVDGQCFETDEQHFFLIRPCSVHSNHSLPTPTGWNLATLHLDTPLMQQIAHSIGQDSLPEFPAFTYRSDILLQNLKAAMMQVFKQNTSLETQSLLYDTLASIVQTYGYSDQPPHRFQHDKDPHRIRQVQEYLNDTHDLSQIDLHTLSKVAAYSPFHFSRMFKKSTGVTPGQYLTLLRIERAKEKIMEGIPLAQAAVESGFYDQAHMNRQFKKHQGITPGHFERKFFAMKAS